MGEIQGESPEKIEGEETMSMTQEEAIVNLEKLIALFHTASEQSKMVDYSKIIETLEFAAAALRPVSRDRIEKVWSGCHECSGCKLCIWNETKKCNDCKNRNSFRPLSDFCPRCGKPLTDAAVDMVMERLEALNEKD